MILPIVVSSLAAGLRPRLALLLCCRVFGCCGPFQGPATEFPPPGAGRAIRSRRRRLADHDHGRAHQPPVERVTFLHHRDHRIRLGVRVLDHAHGLVQGGSNGSPAGSMASIWNLRSASRKLFSVSSTPSAIGLEFLVVAAGRLQGALKIVDHRQQLAAEALEGKLARLFDVLLRAALDCFAPRPGPAAPCPAPSRARLSGFRGRRETSLRPPPYPAPLRRLRQFPERQCLRRRPRSLAAPRARRLPPRGFLRLRACPQPLFSPLQKIGRGAGERSAPQLWGHRDRFQGQCTERGPNQADRAELSSREVTSTMGITRS
jgi:hypothetical protein